MKKKMGDASWLGKNTSQASSSVARWSCEVFHSLKLYQGPHCAQVYDLFQILKQLAEQWDSTCSQIVSCTLDSSEFDYLWLSSQQKDCFKKATSRMPNNIKI